MGFIALSERDAQELFDRLVQALEDRKPLSTIAALVSMHPKVLERQDAEKMTVLSLACRLKDPCCSFEVVKYLTIQCPSSISKLNRDGHAPLHIASNRAYPLETIQLLIHKNSFGHISEWGHTVLSLACAGHLVCPENIQYLASRWPVACLIQTDGKLPVDWVAVKGKLETRNARGSIETLPALTQCTVDSIIALVDIVKHDRTAVPWRLAAHVTANVCEMLDCSVSKEAQRIRQGVQEIKRRDMASTHVTANVCEMLDCSVSKVAQRIRQGMQGIQRRDMASAHVNANVCETVDCSAQLYSIALAPIALALAGGIAVYAATTLFERIHSIVNSKAADNDLTSLTEEGQGMFPSVHNEEIQTWLKDTRNQKLINGFVKMKKARGKDSPSADIGLSKHMQILESVSDNTDCLFLHLRDNLQIFDNFALQLIRDSILPKEVFRLSIFDSSSLLHSIEDGVIPMEVVRRTRGRKGRKKKKKPSGCC